MIPDPGEILRRRVTATTVVRIAALIPVMASVTIVAVWAGTAISSRMYMGEHIGYAAACAIFLAFAVLLWTLAPFNARRSVRMPKSVVCPACNYKIRGLIEARCPECGLPLTAEFIAKPGEKTPPPRDPDRTTMRQFATGIVRVLGVIGLVATVPGFIISGIETIRYMGSSYQNQYQSLNDTLIPTMYFGMFALLFLLLMLSAKALSGLIVPPRSAFEPKPLPACEPGSNDPPPIG